MKNQLVFNRAGQEIRVIKDENNEPLFCLRDICDSLEMENPANIKNAILKEFEGRILNIHPFETQGGIQHFTMITEPQLYFMLMRSDKPKAREFRQWVINEVLPSIRKHGSYTVSSNTDNRDNKEFVEMQRELINTQKELINTQNALLEEFKNRKTPKSILDNVDMKDIKIPKDKTTKKASRRIDEMYKQLRFMVKVLSSIPQAGITQKMVWSYLYKVIIREFNYKKQLSIKIIKENKEFLSLIHTEANNLLKKAQELSFQEQETLENINYQSLFEIR